MAVLMDNEEKGRVVYIVGRTAVHMINIDKWETNILHKMGEESI